jgi:hypothetical protein
MLLRGFDERGGGRRSALVEHLGEEAAAEVVAEAPACGARARAPSERVTATSASSSAACR